MRRALLHLPLLVATFMLHGCRTRLPDDPEAAPPPGASDMTADFASTDLARRVTRECAAVAGSNPWGMFRGGPLHRGSSPVVGPRSGNAQAFIPPANLYRYRNVAIAADGTLVITSTTWTNNVPGDNTVQAIDPRTRMQRWSYSTGDGTPYYPAIGPDGTVFVAAGQQYAKAQAGRGLYALDGASGALKWHLPITPQGVADPTVDAQGTVFVVSGGGTTLHAVDGATGKERWKFESGGYPAITSPAVGADGTVFFLSGSQLFAVNGETGTKKWELAVGNTKIAATHSAPAIGPRGLVIVHLAGEQVEAVDPSTGMPVWRFRLGDAIAATNPAPTAPAISPDCTVYIGANDRKLYAIDGFDGTLRWTYPVGQVFGGIPAVGDDGTVYVAGEGFHAVDGATGLPLWVRKDVPANANTSPSIAADGTIYHMAGLGGLYAFLP